MEGVRDGRTNGRHAMIGSIWGSGRGISDDGSVGGSRCRKGGRGC